MRQEEQLEKQKTLNAMYINREKEIRRELERLKSDAETQSTAKMSAYVRGNIKR